MNLSRLCFTFLLFGLSCGAGIALGGCAADQSLPTGQPTFYHTNISAGATAGRH